MRIGPNCAPGEFNTASDNGARRKPGPGLLGIGTTNPTRAKVEISGSTNANPSAGAWYNSVGATTFGAASQAVSLYADANIAAQSVFVPSDGRIKRIEGRSNAARDLATLDAVELTDYSYIDNYDAIAMLNVSATQN